MVTVVCKKPQDAQVILTYPDDVHVAFMTVVAEDGWVHAAALPVGTMDSRRHRTSAREIMDLGFIFRTPLHRAITDS
jgi:hypothetical protein